MKIRTSVFVRHSREAADIFSYFILFFYVWIFISAAPRQLWRRLGDDTQKRFDSRGGRTTHLQKLKKRRPDPPVSLKCFPSSKDFLPISFNRRKKFSKGSRRSVKDVPQTNPNIFVTFFDGDRLFTCLCRNNKVDKKKPDHFDRTILLERINRMVISENVEGPDEFLPVGRTHNHSFELPFEWEKKCLHMYSSDNHFLKRRQVAVQRKF